MSMSQASRKDKQVKPKSLAQRVWRAHRRIDELEKLVKQLEDAERARKAGYPGYD